MGSWGTRDGKVWAPGMEMGVPEYQGWGLMNEQGLPGVSDGKRATGEPALGPRERRGGHLVSRIWREMWMMCRAVPGHQPRAGDGDGSRGPRETSGGSPSLRGPGRWGGRGHPGGPGGDIRDGEGGSLSSESQYPAPFSRCRASGLLPVPVGIPWSGARFPVPVPGPTAPGGAAPPRRT